MESTGTYLYTQICTWYIILVTIPDAAAFTQAYFPGPCAGSAGSKFRLNDYQDPLSDMDLS